MRTSSRGKRACMLNALPVRRWHARQWHIEIRTGSPSATRLSCPQLQAAWRGVIRRSYEADVVSRAQARELALALPEAVEQDHHGRPSFRGGGKVFATQWDAEHMNVMLDEDGIRTAIHERPAACEEVWWGKRLAAVRVDLRRVERATLVNLLTDAWE